MQRMVKDIKTLLLHFIALVVACNESKGEICQALSPSGK